MRAARTGDAPAAQLGTRLFLNKQVLAPDSKGARSPKGAGGTGKGNSIGEKETKPTWFHLRRPADTKAAAQGRGSGGEGAGARGGGADLPQRVRSASAARPLPPPPAPGDFREPGSSGRPRPGAATPRKTPGPGAGVPRAEEPVRGAASGWHRPPGPRRPTRLGLPFPTFVRAAATELRPPRPPPGSAWAAPVNFRRSSRPARSHGANPASERSPRPAAGAGRGGRALRSLGFAQRCPGPPTRNPSARPGRSSRGELSVPPQQCP